MKYINIVLVLLCFVLSACRTTEYVEVAVHDTITVQKVDSIRQIIREKTIVNNRDSVSHTEYQRGDTIYIRDYKEIITNIEKEISDSTLKAIVDSISRIYHNSSKEYVEVEKPPNIWERIKMFFGDAFVWFIILVVIYFTILLKRK